MHYQNNNRGSTIIFKFIKYGILVFFVVIGFSPVLWVLISSFKTNQTILDSALSLPTALHWENYISAIQVTGLPRHFFNSIVVSTSAVILNVIIALLAAYVLARFEFMLNIPLTIMFYLGFLIPINSAVVPIKFIMLKLGLNNSLIGLIILYVALGLPVSILILKNFLSSIPVQLEEAARIDGAGYWEIFFKIIFPLSRSGLATVMILQFLFCWNEFLFATLLINTETKRTLQMAINFFIGKFSFDYGGLFAAMTVSIVPSIIVFIFFQEKVISGLTAGAIKE